jgi:hypothetical protein
VPLAFHSGREADHSPPSSAEVKEWVELYLHSPNTSSWRGAETSLMCTFLDSLCLIRNRDSIVARLPPTPALGVHSAYYPMGTGGSFPGGKAAGA